MDNTGADAGVQGMLLYKAGTVCDDYFSDNSAEAICRLLGHDGHFSWTSGQKWDIQSAFSIHMLDVLVEMGVPALTARLITAPF